MCISDILETFRRVRRISCRICGNVMSQKWEFANKHLHIQIQHQILNVYYRLIRNNQQSEKAF